MYQTLVVYETTDLTVVLQTIKRLPSTKRIRNLLPGFRRISEREAVRRLTAPFYIATSRKNLIKGLRGLNSSSGNLKLLGLREGLTPSKLRYILRKIDTEIITKIHHELDSMIRGRFGIRKRVEHYFDKIKEFFDLSAMDVYGFLRVRRRWQLHIWVMASRILL